MSAATTLAMDPALLARVSAQHAYKRAHAANLAAARRDAAIFNAMVLRDENTGKPINLAPVHLKWHKILDDYNRVVFWSHVEAGKTQQISVGRALFELGCDPNLRIVVVSRGQDMAKKIVRSAAQYVENSKDLREVFPHLQPARDRGWTAQAFTVQRESFAKDPSFQALSVHGQIMGARIDLLILDDILDTENTGTEHTREDVWTWVQASLMGRLTEGARVWVLGNAWHPRDLMHKFAALPRYKSYTFPVLDQATGRSTWPERWPERRIEEWRQDSPIEFERQLLCKARSEDDAHFKLDWIQRAKDEGNGYELVTHLETELPPGYMVVTGVDLASRKEESADLTVLFTTLVHPNGCKQVLNIRAGRMAGPEIITAIDDVYHRFGGIVVVENNAAQHYILQFAEKLTPAACVPFTTGKNKAHPSYGVHAVGAEMAAGKWIIPNHDGRCAKEVDAWISEMLYYNPAEHVGDRLMASWFVREYSRRIHAQEHRAKDGIRVTTVG